jgi:hypothetical protein
MMFDRPQCGMQICSDQAVGKERRDGDQPRQSVTLTWEWLLERQNAEMRWRRRRFMKIVMMVALASGLLLLGALVRLLLK